MAVTGSVVLLRTTPIHVAGCLRRILRYRWTSHASLGTVSECKISVPPGCIRQVKYIPSSTAAPDANYDVKIVDDDGLDILFGLGADRTATAPDLYTLEPEYNHDGGLFDLQVSNAGNSKQGEIEIVLDGD